MKPQIVFVDDDSMILAGFRRILRGQASEWDLHFFSEGQLAWEFIEKTSVDAVVSDITMPELSGIELLRRMRSSSDKKHIPVVVVTGNGDRTMKVDMLRRGATDFLSKPVDDAELLTRLRSVIGLKLAQDELREKNRSLEEQIALRTRQLQCYRMQMIWRLGKAGEFRDEDTGTHVVRVASYSRAIAEEMGLPESYCDSLFLAAPLHDIGKIGITDSILLKPGRLSPSERAQVETHCRIGARILAEPGMIERRLVGQSDQCWASDPLMLMAQEIALSHHEHWDGHGYPEGLSGTSIPLSGRIVAVADVYDALTSRRPYKDAVSEDEAFETILDQRGKHFDPQVVDAFEKVFPQLKAIREQIACEMNQSVDAETHASTLAPPLSFSDLVLFGAMNGSGIPSTSSSGFAASLLEVS